MSRLLDRWEQLVRRLSPPEVERLVQQAYVATAIVVFFSLVIVSELIFRSWVVRTVDAFSLVLTVYITPKPVARFANRLNEIRAEQAREWQMEQDAHFQMEGLPPDRSERGAP